MHQKSKISYFIIEKSSCKVSDYILNNMCIFRKLSSVRTQPVNETIEENLGCLGENSKEIRQEFCNLYSTINKGCSWKMF